MKNHVLWRLHPAARGKRPGRGENKSRVRSRPLSSWKNCGYGADTKSKILSESTRWGKCGEHPRNRNRLIRHYQRIKRFVLYPEPVYGLCCPKTVTAIKIKQLNPLFRRFVAGNYQSSQEFGSAIGSASCFLLEKNGCDFNMSAFSSADTLIYFKKFDSFVCPVSFIIDIVGTPAL